MQGCNILVTAIGSFSADAVITTLQQHNYKVIGTNIYPKEWIANAIVVDCFYQVPLASEEKEYINTMLDICKKECVSYIFPLTDVEIDVFNKYRKVFEDIGVVLCMSSYETIITCRDKRKASDILKDIPGIHVIPEYREEDIKNESIKFPVICKKIDGRSSQGLKKINDAKELSLFIDNNELDMYVIQPFLKGDILTVDVVRDAERKNCVAIPRRELLRTLNGAGTSVHIIRDSELESLCEKIAEQLDINGCVNFEFIETDEKKYFLECNPRFSGGVMFTCMSGYDCILNHLRCFQGKEIARKGNIVLQYIARKYKECVTRIES
ncbi:ATP-grasp domain-containing protein [Lachnoclostridium sp. An118]|uniref:ATP-grasp domain-containing protein n=1 Tax=Lachnoclostridium sp. An118 TaxID=1965547 RepID=UPI000B3AFD23|nr:ATP-grasp domain-containing protein [Lachnoclostridium sp. An118]OUQ47381.1 carbamoyl-phosphate synthase large subunit [Lachnoclostridium sp. An118]